MSDLDIDRQREKTTGRDAILRGEGQRERDQL